MVDSIHPIGHEGADTLRAQAAYFQAAQAALTAKEAATSPQNDTALSKMQTYGYAVDLTTSLAGEEQFTYALRALFDKATQAMARQDTLETTHYLLEYFKLLGAAQPGWQTSLSQAMGVKRYGATWMWASLRQMTEGPYAAQQVLTQSLAREVEAAEKSQPPLSAPVLSVLRQAVQTVETQTTNTIAQPPRPDAITPALQQSSQQLNQLGQPDWSDRLNLYALMQAQLQVLRAQQPFLGRNDYLARTGLPAAYFATPLHPVDHTAEALAWQAFSPIEHTDRVEPIAADPNEEEQRRRRRQHVRQADTLLRLNEHPPEDDDDDSMGGW
ncbi:MAG: hypothetical protein QE263_05320 [Vampirovibrionales bacterium]|nr:hypothetical protein [Vampirovibrionales bacterium]